MKEHQLVINHFINKKLLREIAKIIQRSHFTLQHVAGRYKKANRLTSCEKECQENFYSM